MPHEHELERRAYTEGIEDLDNVFAIWRDAPMANCSRHDCFPIGAIETKGRKERVSGIGCIQYAYLAARRFNIENEQFLVL